MTLTNLLQAGGWTSTAFNDRSIFSSSWGPSSGRRLASCLYAWKVHLPSISMNTDRTVSKASATDRNAPMGLQLPPVQTLKAVLFDVDGTLADSDPLHFKAFRDMLQEVGFQGGIPITQEFFSKYISGKHNPDIGAALFPDWDEAKREKFLDDKEAYFRRLAAQSLQPVKGLHRFCKWVEDRGLRRAAVTNAPRVNAELMIKSLGLADFFELLVVGSECKLGKPFPDPYLKALDHLRVSPIHTFALEDSPAGLSAAVAAGLAAVGLTTGNPGPALLEAGAAFLAESFDDPVLWKALDEN